MKERRAQILDSVNLKGTVSFSELSQLFPDVSEMTLRKDLKSLDEEGKLVRIHGGARSLETVLTADTPLMQRMSQNIDLKREIAAKARTLVQPGMTVFMDSGSTMTEFAKSFPDVSCTVFTVGVSCVQELCRLNQPEIYMLAGKVNRSSMSVRDAQLANSLQNLYFDIAFVGVNGFSIENGFSCYSSDRWNMEKAAVSRSARVAVLMDSTKAGRICPFSICDLKEIDVLVSDHRLDSQTKQMMENVSVEVL